MQISSNLPLPVNAGRPSLQNRQRGAAEAEQDKSFSDGGTQTLATAEQPSRHFRFVMPENATTRSGQIALREYQMIQNEGEAELVNRIDVRV